MANTYEKVLSVISKKPEHRQDFEIIGLLPWLRKKSQLFQQLKTDYLKDIVRNCGLASFKAEDIIIKQGERGECFYIILDGKISIFIINKDKDDGSDENALAHALAQIGSKDNNGKLDRSKLGNFVTHLGSGVPFGEVALISEDCIRTASIIAEEKTDLLRVDRALYNRAVKDVLAREFEEKRYFISTNPLFSNWIPKYRKQLAMAMYKESFPYDALIVRQGEPVANIYFVISGQVEVRTDPVSHAAQYPKLFELMENERDKLIKEKRMRPPTEPQNTATNVKKKDSSKSLKMCYLGKNESIGEMEILLDLSSYVQTARCTERTDVLVLEMKHYERLFVRRHPKTIERMREHLEVKLDTRMSVQCAKENSDVPIWALLQKRVRLMNSPTPQPEKKKKTTTSVKTAEKQFLNHKGPLLDMDGPGSVFYMIRMREKSKLKFKAYQNDKMNNNSIGRQLQLQQQQGHVHSIRLPQALLTAAQMAGAVQTGESVTVVTPGDVIDGDHSRHEQSDKNSGQKRRAPLSFRRIQSAKKLQEQKISFEEQEESKDVEHKLVDRPKSLPIPRALPAVSFDMDEDSNESLNILEERVRDWLYRNSPRGGSQVAKLRRLPLEEMANLPRPGNKVVIRKRRLKSKDTDSSSSSTEKASVEKPVPITKPVRKESKADSLEKFKILLENS